MSKFGIDISTYQRNINLMTAKSEGVEFAILRAGFTGYGTGVSKNIDNAFQDLYKKCKYLSIPVGAYWYSCATDYEKGKAEAEFMYQNCLKDKTFEYPIYIDVEDSYHQAKAGKKAVTEAIKGFCEYLEAKGYYVGIYANSNWFNNYIDTPSLSKYDKWVASWGKNRPTNPEHGLWQFGGETNLIRTNKIAGLTCDQNYSFKDYTQIIKENNLNGFNNNSNTVPALTSEEVHKIALEVISGKWGNGEERKTKLISSGYDYNVIQTEVNNILLSNTPKEVVYTVQPGDNLSIIAKKYNTTWKTIYENNKAIIGSKPNIIKAGQRLVIK